MTDLCVVFFAECGETHARASALHDETGTATPMLLESTHSFFMFTVPPVLQLVGTRVQVSVTACFPVLNQQRK